MVYFVEKIKKYRYNYLLIGAVVAYCTFLFSLLFYPENKAFILAHRRFKEVNFIMIFLYGILIAPTLEEILFRGAFTNNKTLRLISFIGLPVFLYVANRSDDIILISLFFFYLILFSATVIIGKRRYLFALLLFVNAFLFAAIHYDKVYWQSVMSFLFLFNQFAAGLLLLWIVLNWNIKRAIFVHTIFNFLIFFPTFLMLQFPSDKVYSLRIDHYEIKWQKQPILNNKIMLMKKDFEISAKNITPLFLYKTFIKTKKVGKLTNKENYYKYNIEIKKIDATAAKLDSVLLKKILLKAGLIEKININD